MGLARDGGGERERADGALSRVRPPPPPMPTGEPGPRARQESPPSRAGLPLARLGGGFADEPNTTPTRAGGGGAFLNAGEATTSRSRPAGGCGGPSRASRRRSDRRAPLVPSSSGVYPGSRPTWARSWTSCAYRASQPARTGSPRPSRPRESSPRPRDPPASSPRWRPDRSTHRNSPSRRTAASRGTPRVIRPPGSYRTRRSARRARDWRAARDRRASTPRAALRRAPPTSASRLRACD